MFGSRNMMFKHLKEQGLEEHDPIGFVEGSSPSTDEGRQARLALQHQHRQGGPAKSKPTVTWAELSDDKQLRRANQGSWRGEEVQVLAVRHGVGTQGAQTTSPEGPREVVRLAAPDAAGGRRHSTAAACLVALE